ncbi:hypothetical protein KDD30_17525 (plasmid) [Photobacterium sp. GJ3]|uniref:hypothetical protein n=1 Tax=Photobacterium sp. GJ3 TaxID=2829502 RepID=UPI001B8D61F8|nr:hypothetical protein [Photobacterium sp. GJ3]QUJ69959.1 hypothetical protein KDD30_17525 [Photobacterium sp. GJ3]
MKRKIAFFITSLFTCVASMKANALQVDKMILVSDLQGNGVFSLTNDLPQTSLVRTKIEEVNVENGQLVKVPYTKDNLNSWKITVATPNLIIEPGRVKPLGVRSLCNGDCNFNRDHVYQLTFAPIPYVDGQETKGKIGINYGFSPLYIIPAKELNISYEMKNLGDKIWFKNTGNSVVRFQIDQCKSQKKSHVCITSFTGLAGREREFKIPDSMRSDSLNVTIASYDNSYFKEFVLKRQE